MGFRRKVVSGDVVVEVVEVNRVVVTFDSGVGVVPFSERPMIVIRGGNSCVCVPI